MCVRCCVCGGGRACGCLGVGVRVGILGVLVHCNGVVLVWACICVSVYVCGSKR